MTKQEATTGVASSLFSVGGVTINDIENAFKALGGLEKEKEEKLLKPKKGLIEKFMNKHGWYRKQAIVVIDSSKFKIVKSYMYP